MHKKSIVPPLFSTVGTKHTAIKQFGLNEFVPPLTDNHSVYCELFMCSGIMFFNTECRSAILNDKDNNIWNFWNCIANHYAELCKEMEFIWRGKAWYDVYITRQDPIGKAVAWYIKIRNNFNGSIKNTEDWYLNAKPRPFYKDWTQWKDKMDQCYLNIWNLDYADALDRINDHATHGREKYFIFEDPPYVDVNFYNLNFTEKDHRELARLNHTSNHHIVLTYNNHPLIKELYADWYMMEANWDYFITGSKNHKTELLLSNKPLKRYPINHPTRFTNQTDLMSLGIKK